MCGERDTAKKSKCRSYVGRRCTAKVFAGLNAPAHQENRNMLIVVVRRSVACARLARLSTCSLANQPVWLRHNEQIPTATGKVAGGLGATNWASCSRAIEKFLGAVDFGNAGNAANRFQQYFHRGGVAF